MDNIWRSINNAVKPTLQIKYRYVYDNQKYYSYEWLNGWAEVEYCTNNMIGRVGKMKETPETRTD